ncbi:stage V sporulation protein AA [Paenibacillus sp. 481]|uniref:stage V sporulation protein AA n=1 Tax=Paenibacillus sp. 481 TaxID=2835869 RepID=UPI001E5850EA|nr:stage V sporulation protein AA [Paenibacillus sp. 481]UHA72916.1 stage V sporulation protein AA [Paenibacillus sp. 481]
MVRSEPTQATCYIRLRRRARVAPGTTIRLGDVAELVTVPEHWAAQLSKLPLNQPTRSDGKLMLVEMLSIAQAIKLVAPEMSIECYGAPHTIVEIAKQPKKPNFVLVALVCMLLFCGSGLAIMNFHADVSMAEVHKRLMELITGQKNASATVFQISYSIGIGVGMLTFFNHIFRSKKNEEPTPLELEMFMYQENVNQYIITEKYARLNSAQHGDE